MNIFGCHGLMAARNHMKFCRQTSATYTTTFSRVFQAMNLAMVSMMIAMELRMMTTFLFQQTAVLEPV